MEVKFCDPWTDADGMHCPYTLIIRYGNNKKYKLPLSATTEIKKIEDFFIQYCQKRNIKNLSC